jgi:hypothetical protein
MRYRLPDLKHHFGEHHMAAEQTPVVLLSLEPDGSKFVKSMLAATLQFPDGHQDSLTVPLSATASYERLRQFIGAMSGGRWLLRSIAADRTDLPARLRIPAEQQAQMRAAHAASVSQHLERMRCPGALSVGGGTAAFSGAGSAGLSRREQLMQMTAVGRAVLESEQAAARKVIEGKPI